MFLLYLFLHLSIIEASLIHLWLWRRDESTTGVIVVPRHPSTHHPLVKARLPIILPSLPLHSHTHLFSCSLSRGLFFFTWWRWQPHTYVTDSGEDWRWSVYVMTFYTVRGGMLYLWTVLFLCIDFYVSVLRLKSSPVWKNANFHPSINHLLTAAEMSSSVRSPTGVLLVQDQVRAGTCGWREPLNWPL